MLTTLLTALMVAAPPDRWPGDEERRATIAVSAPDAGVAAGYAVSVRFDHRAEVLAGNSLVDGTDVGLFDWADGGFVELERVVDTGSAWAADSGSLLWFKLPRAIPLGRVDDSFTLFWGGAARTPREDARHVFTFFDSFERASLGTEWRVGPLYPNGVMVPSTLRAHGGARALLSRPDGTSGSQRLVNMPIPDGVEVDSWASCDLINPDMGWLVRFTLPEQTLIVMGGAPGQPWELAHRDNGTWYSIAAGTGTLLDSGWRRVTVRVIGTEILPLVDGVPIFGAPYAYPGYSDGTVGIGRGDPTDARDGGRDLFIDDFRVRPFQWREPVAAVQATTLAPGVPCVTDAQCASGRCGGSGCASFATDAGAGDGGAGDGGADAGTPDAGAEVEVDGGSVTPRRLHEVGCGCRSSGLLFAFSAALILRRRLRAR